VKRDHFGSIWSVLFDSPPERESLFGGKNSLFPNPREFDRKRLNYRADLASQDKKTLQTEGFSL
jgi:hypothetical protein